MELAKAASSIVLAGHSSDAGSMVTITLAAAVLLLIVTVSVVGRRGAAGGKLVGNNKVKLPPSPPALPFFGHLHLIRPPPHQSFHRLVRRRYGPLVYLRMGPSNHAVIVGSAEAARDLLRVEASIQQRGHSAVTRLLAYDTAGFDGQESITNTKSHGG